MPTLDQAAGQLGISEKTLRKWMKRLGIERTRHPQDWRYWLITPEQLQQIAEERAKMPTATIPTASKLAFDRRQSVDGRYSDTSPVQSGMPRSRQIRTHASKARGKDLPPLPDGHIGRHELATVHEIPPANVDYWCYRGDIEYLSGLYRNARGNRVKDPVTPKGLAQFYQLASPRSDFVQCELCPHRLAEEEGNG